MLERLLESPAADPLHDAANRRGDLEKRIHIDDRSLDIPKNVLQTMDLFGDLLKSHHGGVAFERMQGAQQYGSNIGIEEAMILDRDQSLIQIIELPPRLGAEFSDQSISIKTTSTLCHVPPFAGRRLSDPLRFPGECDVGHSAPILSDESATCKFLAELAKVWCSKCLWRPVQI